MAEQLEAQFSCALTAAPAPGQPPTRHLLSAMCFHIGASHTWSSLQPRAGWVKTGRLGCPVLAPKNAVSPILASLSCKQVKGGKQ